MYLKKSNYFFQLSCDKSPPEEEKMQTDCSSEGALSITDYSPEWAYPEGGAKVLIAGPWTESSDQYTVLFDNFPVPSKLVQNGLLRCYCPGKYNDGLFCYAAKSPIYSH